VTRVYGLFAADRVDIDPGGTVIRAEGISQYASALVAEVVLAVVERSEPLAWFEEYDGESGFGEFFGDNTASGAAADDHRVDVFQGHHSQGLKPTSDVVLAARLKPCPSQFLLLSKSSPDFSWI